MSPYHPARALEQHTETSDDPRASFDNNFATAPDVYHAARSTEREGGSGNARNTQREVRLSNTP
eukprot:6490341-Alexandrium_andersonii.AAC.1